MYLVETNTVNYCVTPNHVMLYQKRDKNGYTEWVRESAETCFGKFKHVRTTATLKQSGHGTYDEGLYLGFLLGDGFRLNGSSIGVRLKRDRKITFFMRLLERLDISYRTKMKISEEGVYTFTISDPVTNLARANAKTLPDLSGRSQDYLRGLLHGLMESDGSKKHSGWTYSSSSKELFNGVMTLASTCGFSVSKPKERHLENPRHSTNYLAIIKSRHHAVVSPKRGDERVVQYDGPVYCVTVPSGLLLVRRNNKQLVCGNSPFSHPKAQFRMTLPIFVARQWEKHRIGCVRGYDTYDQNEISRRYVDDTPQFWSPSEWRRRPDGSIKQGSGAKAGEVTSEKASGLLGQAVRGAREAYERLLALGIAPEQARIVLPQSTYTSWIETGSLAYWSRLCILRLDAHAQQEISELARQVAEQMAEKFPVSWAALEN
jgi:thymidylate synthase (FAD)